MKELVLLVLLGGVLAPGCLGPGEVGSGNMSVSSGKEGIIFIENLRDPHPITDAHPQQLNMVKLRFEGDKVMYVYVYRGPYSSPQEQYIKVAEKGRLHSGEELRYSGIEASIQKTKVVPEVEGKGEAYRISTRGERRYGVGFFSNRTLLVSREPEGSGIEYYVMPVESCGVMDVRGYNLSIALESHSYPPREYDYIVSLNKDYVPGETLEISLNEPVPLAFPYSHYSGVMYNSSALTLTISSLRLEENSNIRQLLYCSGNGPSTALMVKRLIVSS